jgi:hypothetical protein
VLSFLVEIWALALIPQAGSLYNISKVNENEISAQSYFTQHGLKLCNIELLVFLTILKNDDGFHL